MKKNIPGRRLLAVVMTCAATCAFIKPGQCQISANTYLFSAVSGSYTEITGGTNIPILQNDDGLSAALPLGFVFNFCGTNYTDVHASSNGWVSFNSSLSSSAYGGYYSNLQGDLVDLKPVLMPLWDDLNGSQTGTTVPTASYTTTGTAPNRVFTIQYKDWRWNLSASGPVISFQIKLYETSNVVEYIYQQGSASVNSGSASIGIGDNDASPGFLMLENTSASPSTSTVNFVTNINAKPATNQVYRFTPIPALELSPDSVITPEHFCSNDSALISAEVSNLGTAAITSMELHWTVNGIAQPVVSYNNSIGIPNLLAAPNNKAIIPLGKAFFADAGAQSIRVWTSDPNGQPDMAPENDTTSRAVAADLQGILLQINPQDTMICTGMSVTLDAGAHPANPLYVWNTGAITRTINVTDGGDYYVKVMNSTGCEARDTVHVTVNPSPSAAAVSAIDLGGGDFSFGVVAAENVDTYEWDFGDNTGLQTGPPPMPHHYTTAGVYAVTLTLINDCGGVTIGKQVNVEQVTGIPEINVLNHAISMYPNPARNQVTLQSKDGLKIRTITFYDLLGRKVYAATVNGDKVLINTAILPAGFYQVVIDTDKGRLSKKLAVEQ